MSRITVKRNVSLVAEKSKTQRRKLDYYLYTATGEKIYAFTRNYSTTCYERCKSPISVLKLLHSKKSNKAYMNMVKYLNFMLPYFIEYYDLNGEEKKIKHVG